MMGDESWISLYFVVYLPKMKRQQKKLYDFWMVLKNTFLDQILAIHDYEFATHRSPRCCQMLKNHDAYCTAI